jgi:hypothetical protein
MTTARLLNVTRLVRGGAGDGPLLPGSEVETLELRPGVVNVLVGGPNTGKTRWLRTLDFLLGDTGGVEDALGSELAEKYAWARAELTVGGRPLELERRWKERGARHKVYVDGRPLASADFSAFLLEALGVPRVRIPRGSPLTPQAWPELSWRMLLRHLYRAEEAWADLAPKQPESEQHAVLLQLLGAAPAVFSPARARLAEAQRREAELAAQAASFAQVLGEVTRELLGGEEPTRAALDAALSATEGVLAAATRARAERLESLRGRAAAAAAGGIGLGAVGAGGGATGAGVGRPAAGELEALGRALDEARERRAALAEEVGAGARRAEVLALRLAPGPGDAGEPPEHALAGVTATADAGGGADAGATADAGAPAVDATAFTEDRALERTEAGLAPGEDGGAAGALPEGGPDVEVVPSLPPTPGEASTKDDTATDGAASPPVDVSLPDASLPDVSLPDASPVDASPVEASPVDASPVDASPVEASLEGLGAAELQAPGDLPADGTRDATAEGASEGAPGGPAAWDHVVHCPACERTLERRAVPADTCALCLEPLHMHAPADGHGEARGGSGGNHAGPHAGGASLEEELSRAQEQVARARERLAGAEADVERLTRQLAPVREAAVWLLPEGFGEAEQEVGRLEERLRQLRGVSQVVARREALDAQLSAAREEVSRLQAEVGRAALVEPELPALGEQLADAMRGYLNALDARDRERWAARHISVSVSRGGSQLLVDGKPWGRKLGANLRAYLFLAYHYAWLRLARTAPFVSPGLVVLDFPANLGELGSPTFGGITDQERYLLVPFVGLLSRPDMRGVQLIAAGRAFASLPGAHRVDLKRRWR